MNHQENIAEYMLKKFYENNKELMFKSPDLFPAIAILCKDICSYYENIISEMEMGEDL